MNIDMVDRSFLQVTKAKELLAAAISPVRAARRLKIIQAAEEVFARHGFRGTSMEAIAEACGMSKVTLYGYFRDKEAVFSAVAEHLAVRLKQAAKAAIEKAGPLAGQLAGALIAKQSIIYHLVRRSAHSADLFHAKDAHAAAVFMAVDHDILAMLVDALVQRGHGRAAAQHTARILFSAANGIASDAINADQLAQDIKILVTAVVSSNL